MLNATSVIGAGVLWLLLLFAVAVYGERHGRRFERVWPILYALSLGVYCTAWTIYGTVAQAERWAIPLPPTFIGTALLMVLGGPLLARLAALAKSQNSASLADLIASRFGKDPALAAWITAVAVLGLVPYVALQLKAVAMSFALLTGSGQDEPAWRDVALWVAVMMAVFAMLFGTRRAAATEHNRGLVLAIAFESLFKLAAMLCVGVYAWNMAPIDALPNLPAPHIDSGFLALVGLGAVAMFTLPHQFHIGWVELRELQHLRTARWLFPLYLVLIALPLLPLAVAGRHVLGAGADADLFVLALPLAGGESSLALLAFLGGLSAATGMVIVVALTLSIMIANHWLAPLVVRSAARESGDLRETVLWHRRLGIVLVLMLAFLYSRAMAASEALADIGALSFAALAQLTPAVLAAVYRPTLRAASIRNGLIAGMLVFAYILLLPNLPAWATGSSRIDLPPWLLPDGLLGLGALDALARGSLAALAANVLLIALSERAPRRQGSEPTQIEGSTLRALAARFLPTSSIEHLFAGDDAQISAVGIAAVERELAPVIGAASARLLVDVARRTRGAEVERVAEIVDEASQTLRFNQQLLEAALENMSQGISVVDAELRLVAWNRHYAERFAYPPELLRVGTPVADLLAWNLQDIETIDHGRREAIERRLQHMRAGTPYVTERRFPDGSVIEIRGNPMPGGGFVATFTDVTEFRAHERELKRAAETLEQRVADRTAALSAASAEAERANQAKTRFLAAVSHDLLQPIHAAHLFTHALAQSVQHSEWQARVMQIDGALNSAESLLAGLLDISRLDAGAMTPEPAAIDLDALLQSLASEFRVLADERGLRLGSVPCRAIVRSDALLLRRVLQNFLANAVRYSTRGRVLLGCRRRGAFIDIEVWDSGPGVAPEHQALIFEEFRRLDRGSQGLGLGLAIAERIARLLDHPLALRSWPGRGSVFSVRVPRCAAEPTRSAVIAPVEQAPRARVLVVDNDRNVLAAMQALLEGWSCVVLIASEPAEALRLATSTAPDLLLLDYHLDGGQDGIELQRQLALAIGPRPCIVITADHSETVRDAVRQAGCSLLNKPVRPLALKSLMNRLLGST